MHMHMYHEYESVYEYGSNAFELTAQPLDLRTQNLVSGFKLRISQNVYIAEVHMSNYWVSMLKYVFLMVFIATYSLLSHCRVMQTYLLF